MTITTEVQKVVIDYTNHRGERRERIVTPLKVGFASSPWHREPQWLLTAHDEEKGDVRDFAMASIHSWRPLNAARQSPALMRAALGRNTPAHLARALTWIEDNFDPKASLMPASGVALVARALSETAR